MGMDTVVLVVDIEKHFDISIPDNEAAKINTVQDIADCVYGKVSVNPSQKCTSQVLFYKLREALVSILGIDRNAILPNYKLSELFGFQDLKEHWRRIESELKLKLPELSLRDLDRSMDKEIKFLGLKIWTRKARVTDGTIGDLVNWILSLNHVQLIDPKNLCDKHDVERIIVGIVSESSGVPIDEIKLTHRITYDLGMD
jgi:acyl carrier protein